MFYISAIPDYLTLLFAVYLCCLLFDKRKMCFIQALILDCMILVISLNRIIDKCSSRLYIVMEYCSGGDLSSLIAKTKRER